MPTTKETKMAKFYAACLEKGYTDMTDENVQLKAKVIAVDLGLKYSKNLVDFFEEAKVCYESVESQRKHEEEQLELQRKETKRKNDMKSQIILTLANKTNKIEVYLREDNSVYHTFNGGDMLDGAPQISVRDSKVYMATYHPSKAVYTGATVGGVTTGGIHYTKPSYSEKTSGTGNGYVTAKARGEEKPIDLRTATVTSTIAKKYKHHGDFKAIFPDNKTCYCYDKAGDKAFSGTKDVVAGKNIFDAMTAMSVMKDFSCLDIQKCQIICDVLHSIVTADFPPTDEEMYQEAVSISSAKDSKTLENAMLIFNEISYYKDSAQKVKDVEKAYEEAVQREKEEAIIRKENNQKKIKLYAIIGAIVAVVVVAVAITVPIILKTATYNEAVQLLENHQYDEAKQQFAELGSFKDSRDMMSEVDYRKAMDLLDQGEYASAAKLFNKLGSYSDSYTMVDESNYQFALHCLEEGSYYVAMEEFEKLDDYKDSEEQYKEAVYRYAKSWYERGSSDSALSLFEDIPGYKDVDSYLSGYAYLAETVYIGSYDSIEIKYDENGKMTSAKSKQYYFTFNEDGTVSRTSSAEIKYNEDGTSILYKSGKPEILFDKYGNVHSMYSADSDVPKAIEGYSVDDKNNATTNDTINKYDENGNLKEVTYNYQAEGFSNSYYQASMYITYSQELCGSDYVDINRNNVRMMFHMYIEA